MLKLRIGGTEGEVAKREEARRMVPSPPKVAVRSTLEDSGVEGGLGVVCGCGDGDGDSDVGSGGVV